MGDKSPRLAMNKTDWLSVVKGVGDAVAGALLTYVTETLPGVEMGEYKLIVVATLTVLIKLARRWLSGPAPEGV